MPELRAYRPSDLAALYQICLLTGDSSQDATLLYDDPELLGAFFSVPYAIHDPQLVLMLEDDLGACGYVVGTPDSTAFEAWMQSTWLPPLRQRFPMPAADDTSQNANMVRLLHNQDNPEPTWLPQYPAHLHINLLPRAQKLGAGKRMIAAICDRLAAHHVPGVHLGVGARNHNAIAFYEHVGFGLLETHDWGRQYGMHLPRKERT